MPLTPAPTAAETTVVDADSNDGRIIAGTLRCIARWGITKTTLDDIATESGVSRATIYRTFPGGKDVILTAVLQHELRVFFRGTSALLDACESLDELLVIGIVETSRFVRDHDALGYLLAHETSLILSHFAMDELDPVLAVAATFVAPHLERFVGREHVWQHADFVVRNVISYILNPSPTIDTGRRADVEQLVATYLVPVLGRRS